MKALRAGVVVCALVVLSSRSARAETAEGPTPAALSPAPEAIAAPPAPEAGDRILRARLVGDEAPTATPAPAPVPAAPPPPEPPHDFYKGELTRVGSLQLVTAQRRVGVRFGYEQIDASHYTLVAPEVDLEIEEVSFGLGVPLRVELFNTTEGFGVHRVRAEDWDSGSDFARVIRYVTYGRKEDKLFLNASQISAVTLGHGALVRRYSANLDVRNARLGLQADAYNDYVGIESFVNDVVAPDLVGGLAFVKPLSFVSDTVLAKATSLGFTYVIGFDTPMALDRFVTGVPRTSDAGRFVVDRSERIYGAGIDLETKILKTEHLDLKPYLDHSWLGGAGTGQTLGLLLRANVGSDSIHAFRVVVEGRRFDADYLPGYFDTFYELSRYQFLGRSSNYLREPKFREVSARRGDSQLGYYLEGSYAWVDKVGTSIGFEDSTAQDGRGYFAHLEVPAFSFLQLFATVHRRHIAAGDPMFQIGETDNTLAQAAFRVRALPVLFFNGAAYKQFELRRATGGYTTINGFSGDIELGWEF